MVALGWGGPLSQIVFVFINFESCYVSDYPKTAKFISYGWRRRSCDPRLNSRNCSLQLIEALMAEFPKRRHKGIDRKLSTQLGIQIQIQKYALLRDCSGVCHIWTCAFAIASQMHVSPSLFRSIWDPCPSNPFYHLASSSRLLQAVCGNVEHQRRIYKTHNGDSRHVLFHPLLCFLSDVYSNHPCRLSSARHCCILEAQV